MTNTSRPFCMLTATACAALCLVLAAGCQYLRQDMADQPKNKPLSPSDFFADGRSERPLVENTVARGSLANDELFVPKESNNFPLPVNLELLERGEERYKIFCSPCHGLQGDGNGMIAMRGMKHPPSYHQDRLRQAPNGYFYDNITNGFGAMYGYSAQIPPRDRWAIIAYIRALQLSRNAKVADLPAALRSQFEPPSGIAGDIPGGAKKGEIGSMQETPEGKKE
ncbi:MAG TPA: cytochrome c [Candidatus Acidoferrum sp.]|nr:cytochrome c [Candidatus Acidoferrum sp.]